MSDLLGKYQVKKELAVSFDLVQIRRCSMRCNTVPTVLLH